MTRTDYSVVFRRIAKNALHTFELNQWSRTLRNRPAKISTGHGLIQRIIGHDLPYPWQFAHEFSLNDDFKLETHGLILPNKRAKALIELGLRAVELSRQQDLAAAFLTLYTNGLSEDGLTEDGLNEDGLNEDGLNEDGLNEDGLNEDGLNEDGLNEAAELIVDRSLTDLRNSIYHITNNKNPDPALSTPFLVQLIQNQAYGQAQLTQLVEHVYNLCAHGAFIETSGFQTWKDQAIFRITRTENVEFTDLAAEIIHQLIRELKSLRNIESNVKLLLFKDPFRHLAPEYERQQIQLALQNGHLLLDRTEPWILAAKQRVDTTSLSTQGQMIAVHREAFSSLITSLAMGNQKYLRPPAVPETLLLDIGRIENIRADVRRISCSLALWKVATSTLTQIGVHFTHLDSSSLFEHITQNIEKAISSTHLLNSIHTLLIHIAKDIPVPDIHEPLLAAISKDSKNPRQLYSKRVTRAIVHSEEHISIWPALTAIQALQKQTERLCSHLETIYSHLYVAMLASLDPEI
jgi:hypothetical protein